MKENYDRIQKITDIPVKNIVENINSLIPLVIKEGKVDIEQLKSILGDCGEDNCERYDFSWTGRGEALKTLQTPSNSTLIPLPNESVNWDSTNNIFIEGENLEVLKIMLKPYYGQVKMIYIDPPYNTGNDFIYPDDFSNPLDTYLKLTQQKDNDENLLTSNPETSGRYHSAWLSMMFPRLFLASQLLSDDGVIFVSIDDHEVHNLRMIMNQIMGEDRFVAIIPWRKRTAKSDVPFGVSQDFEWIVVYANSDFKAGKKLIRKYQYSPDSNEGWRLSDLTVQRTSKERPNSAFDLINPKNKDVYRFNPNRVWGVTKDTYMDYINKRKIVFPGDYSFLKIKIPAFRVFESEDKDLSMRKYGTEEAMTAISTLLPIDVGRTEDGTEEIINLFGSKVFPYPKPSSLIKYLISIVGGKDFTVLDFFAGSCTTAQSIFEVNLTDHGNRNFILVQLPEPTAIDSDAHKAGYKTIAEIGKERIRRVIHQLNNSEIKKINSENNQDRGFKVFKLEESNFQTWPGIENLDVEGYRKQIELFSDSLVNGWKIENVIAEIVLKEAGFSLNYSIEKIEPLDKQKVFRITDPNSMQVFYSCLDNKIELKNLKFLGLKHDDVFICRASALDDTTSANLALQCRLKVI
jgi:adenine-specific DNA-methyltransferase